MLLSSLLILLYYSFNAEDFECDAACRITTCRVCYYADEYRPLPDCDTCPTYPDVHNIERCFSKWGTCVRRANAALYTKVSQECISIGKSVQHT